MLSVALGVAGLVSVEGTLTDTRDLLYREARDRLGADLTLSAWRPLDDPWSTAQLEQLHQLGDVARVTELASMAQPIIGGELGGQPSTPRLISLKGVQDTYPLRGDLMISRLDARGELLPPQPTRARALSRREVWVNPNLWEQVKRGARSGTPRAREVSDQPKINGTSETSETSRTIKTSQLPALKIGRDRFTIAGVISREPDAGLVGGLSFAPRVMIRHEALIELGLIQAGSRVRHKALFALASSGERSARARVRRLERSLNQDAPLHVTVQSFSNAQPNTLQVFESVGVFFILVGLVALCLCLVSLISGAWSVVNDLLPITAIARALGVGPRVMRRAYFSLFLFIGLLGSALGLCVAWSMQRGLNAMAEPLLGAPLSVRFSLSQSAWALGLGVGMSLIVNGLVQRGLSRMTSHELWSQQRSGLALSRWDLSAVAALTLCVVSGYVTLTSGSAALGALFAVGLLVMSALVALVIGLSLFGARRILAWSTRWSSPAGLRFALRQLLGYRQRTWVSLLTLGVSFSLIGGLLLVSESLSGALTPDTTQAPQVFLIDVQDDQRELVEEVFREGGARGGDSSAPDVPTSDQPTPDLRPLIRARITAINGARITREMMSGDRPAQQRRARSLRREYNLTTQLELSPSERLSAGQWWSRGEALSSSTRSVSVEKRHASRMGLTLGDEVTFDLQGREMSFRVTSLRDVNWLSFTPNFLYVLPPGPLERAPKMWVGSAQLTPYQRLDQLSAALFERAPNITLLDLRPILAEARGLIGTLTAALRVTGGVCVIAGLLLLMGNLRRERDRRDQSVRLLYALGISRARARRWITLELLLLGLLAAVAVTSGVVVCARLATRALNIPLADPYVTITLWSVACIVAPALISRSTPERSAA